VRVSILCMENVYRSWHYNSPAPLHESVKFTTSSRFHFPLQLANVTSLSLSRVASFRWKAARFQRLFLVTKNIITRSLSSLIVATRLAKNYATFNLSSYWLWIRWSRMAPDTSFERCLKSSAYKFQKQTLGCYGSRRNPKELASHDVAPGR